MKTFKDFLIEYAFKEQLPRNTSKIYPMPFTEADIKLFSGLFPSANLEQYVGSSEQLCCNLNKGDKFNNKRVDRKCRVYIKNFRDRYRFNVEDFDDGAEVKSVNRTNTHKFDIAHNTQHHIKRVLGQKLSPMMLDN